jgi:hypothetical protein
LDRAFREHSLVPFDSHFDAIHDWEHAVIGRQNSSIVRPGFTRSKVFAYSANTSTIDGPRCTAHRTRLSPQTACELQLRHP